MSEIITKDDFVENGEPAHTERDLTINNIQLVIEEMQELKDEIMSVSGSAAFILGTHFYSLTEKMDSIMSYFKDDRETK